MEKILKELESRYNARSDTFPNYSQSRFSPVRLIIIYKNGYSRRRESYRKDIEQKLVNISKDENVKEIEIRSCTIDEELFVTVDAIKGCPAIKLINSINSKKNNYAKRKK